MTEQQKQAVDALTALSSLAADFKVGIVSEEYIQQLIEAILKPMALTPEESAAGIRRGMRSWTFED